MGEEYLFCNFKNCKSPLTKVAWITRCSHVFCEEHGNSFFHTRSVKVKCPACNEINSRETDVIKSNLNPHDMLLCCVRPEKALEYVTNATKLWSYQMRQKTKINIENLIEKYERLATEALLKLKSENSELKKFLMDLDQKLKTISKELELTKRRLRKYKMAYLNSCSRSEMNNLRVPDTTFFNEINEDLLNKTMHLERYPSFENILNAEQ